MFVNVTIGTECDQSFFCLSIEVCGFEPSFPWTWSSHMRNRLLSPAQALESDGMTSSNTASNTVATPIQCIATQKHCMCCGTVKDHSIHNRKGVTFAPIRTNWCNSMKILCIDMIHCQRFNIKFVFWGFFLSCLKLNLAK